MTSLALAIVFVAVLWVLERNKAWSAVWRGTKRASKTLLQIVAILIASGLVLWGIFALIKSHNDAVAKRVKEKRDEERTQLLSKLEPQVCGPNSKLVTRVDPGVFWPKGTVACADQSNVLIGLSEEACAKVMASIPEYACKPLRTIEPPYPTGFRPVHEQSFSDWLAAKQRKGERVEPRQPRSETQLRVIDSGYAKDLTTTKSGSLRCATLRVGDVVTLISSDDGSYPPQVQVRTADGVVGWARQENFEVVHEKN